MTQEQAQEILATVNGKLEMKRLEAVNLLFREIDELKMMEEDAQQYALKCRKELEALQQRSCKTCKYYDTERPKSHPNYAECNNRDCPLSYVEVYYAFCCNRYEAKEQ